MPFNPIIIYIKELKMHSADVLSRFCKSSKGAGVRVHINLEVLHFLTVRLNNQPFPDKEETSKIATLQERLLVIHKG